MQIEQIRPNATSPWHRAAPPQAVCRRRAHLAAPRAAGGPKHSGMASRPWREAPALPPFDSSIGVCGLAQGVCASGLSPRNRLEIRSRRGGCPHRPSNKLIHSSRASRNPIRSAFCASSSRRVTPAALRQMPCPWRRCAGNRRVTRTHAELVAQGWRISRPAADPEPGAQIEERPYPQIRDGR
jgi:hypothetical protein